MEVMKMKRKKSWFQSLNKTERAHVRWSMGFLRVNLANFMEHRETQKKMHKEHGGSEPCWECLDIEHKLQQRGFIE